MSYEAYLDMAGAIGGIRTTMGWQRGMSRSRYVGAQLTCRDQVGAEMKGQTVCASSIPESEGKWANIAKELAVSRGDSRVALFSSHGMRSSWSPMSE